jgi:hypothetical protein
MIFIMLYDTFIDSESPQMEKAFFSLASFFIWIRIMHLLKLFEQSSFLLRLSARILYNLRYLLIFMFITIIGCGVTFYFLTAEDFNTPQEGIEYIFLVFAGFYQPEDFNNVYLDVLLVIMNFIIVFFFGTLIISVAVHSYSTEKIVDENIAYKDKCAMIGLYSYMLTDKPFRDLNKKYLAIATVEEKRGAKAKGDEKKNQAKMMKNFEKRIRGLETKVEKSFKDVMDRLDLITDQK